MRRLGGTAEIILLQEGVTQGDPLSMVLYEFLFIPLAKFTRLAVLQLEHVWYADNAALAGLRSETGRAAHIIMEHGLDRGYYMEPEKPVLVYSPCTLDAALDALSVFEFSCLNGLHYLGCYIGLRIAWTE